MLRIFISFYLFIVVALAGLSAVLDRIMVDQDPELDNLELLANSIAAIKTSAELGVLASQSKLEIDIISQQELSFLETQQQQLMTSGFLITYDEDDQPFIYSQLDSEQLVRTQVPITGGDTDHVFWYRVVFFAALAFLVALWSWPIWRDIKKLESGARSVQADGSIKNIALGASSSLNVIAEALQSLSQQVRKLLNNQRELTSAVAHEFRTPMARLKFAMESLEDSTMKISMVEDLTELETLIQEMLEFSQSEHQQPELSFAEILVSDMVEGLFASLPRSKIRDMNIQNQCDDVILRADGHFVERAISNLLSNALKYADSKIIISTTQTATEIIITVEDDGPGIAEEMQEKIFDAFYRPDKSRARHQGGAGLGLAIVKRIQQWHHGHCKVESASLGGAKFILSYPKSI